MSRPRTSEESPQNLTKKLRVACDACHQAKIKCSGSTPCSSCVRAGHNCVYSPSKPSGRPKGTKNSRRGDQSESDKSGNDKSGNDKSCGEDAHAEVGAMRRAGPESTSNDKHQDDGNASGALLDLSDENPISMLESPSQNYQWTYLQPGSPQTLDSRTSSSVLGWPNAFHMQAVGNQMYPLDYFSFDASMGISTFDLPENNSLQNVQNGPSVGILPDTASSSNLHLFPQRAPWMANTSEAPFGTLSPGNPAHCSKNGESSKRNDVHIGSSGTGTGALVSNTSSQCSQTRRPSTSNSLPILQKDTTSSPTLDTQSSSPDSSTLSTPTSETPSRSSSCLCLQHHAKLLVRLKDLWRGSSAAPIDVVLNGVQQALTPWNHYIQCRVCQLDEDQEVLTLSAMSIRAVLRLLQSAYKVISLTHDVSTLDSRQHKRKRTGALGGTKCALGSYEVTGEERMLVLELLLSKTLGKIQLVLGCLKKRSSGRGSPMSKLGEEPMNARQKDRAMDLGHLQALLLHLETTLQMLSADLAK